MRMDSIMTASIHLHLAMSHAQAHQVCQSLGMRLTQDQRGNLRLQPATVRECSRCWSHFTGPLCPICNEPKRPEAA